MTLEALKEEIAAILEIDASQITEETSNQTLPSWDSMATLRIISFLDGELDGELESEDSEKLVSVRAIVDFARSRGMVE